VSRRRSERPVVGIVVPLILLALMVPEPVKVSDALLPIARATLGSVPASKPLNGRLVAAIVPRPEANSEAPVLTFIWA
jgi:hypothetical protein